MGHQVSVIGRDVKIDCLKNYSEVGVGVGGYVML